jgi:hypothetical protein
MNGGGLSLGMVWGRFVSDIPRGKVAHFNHRSIVALSHLSGYSFTNTNAGRKKMLKKIKKLSLSVVYSSTEKNHTRSFELQAGKVSTKK